MGLYKRANSPHWQISIAAPDGRRIQRTTGTEDKRAAQELHDKIKADLWRQSRLAEKPVRYWQDAVKAWFSEQEGHKKSLDRDRYVCRVLHPHLYGKTLDSITRVKLAEITRACLDAGQSSATVNRTLAFIRALLNKAYKEWEWIDRVPAVKLLPEPTRRVRYLTHDEAQRLLSELPQHLADMARFSLATGLRELNVVQLQWDNIDLTRECCWVWHDDAKGKASLAVPLNQDALTVLQRNRGKHQQFVFTFKGAPVTRANNHAWRKALIRADIHDFRWHDLRHTWASWHVQAGTPLHVLQELGGWKSTEMVRRYAHLSPGHLAEWAKNVDSVPTIRLVSGDKNVT